MMCYITERVWLGMLILAAVSTSLQATEVENYSGDFHVVCSDREFACGDGTCIPLTWQCDASADCEDQADEKGCEKSARNCTSKEFACHIGGVCIPEDFHCDGDVDCPDASDETECMVAVTCAPGHYDCGDHNCIPHRWVCDGDADCANRSDETDCKNSTLSVTCSPEQYRCKDNTCIHATWACDGEPDCRDGEDELNCSDRTCKETEFRCDSGQCIPLAQRCNQKPDCEDHTDEEKCYEKKACKHNEFRCVSDGSCIKAHWKCDGDADCPDGSDERKCAKATCSPDELQCKDGSCIPERWMCDGDPDCPKGEDEKHCKKEKQHLPKCEQDEYTCMDGSCIKLGWHCDGDEDCDDGSDESDCQTVCDHDEMQCSDLSCVPTALICNGIDDCPSGEDETNCTTVACIPGQFQCHKGHQCIDGALQCDGANQCQDGSDELNCPKEIQGCNPTEEFDCNGDGKQCIPLIQLCDGKNDCQDWQDEASQMCNKTNPCLDNNGGCSHICRFTPTCTDVICLCPDGYELTTDNHTCHDINECERSHECDQVCINTNGSYDCGCLPGYVPHPDNTEMCKAIDERKTLLLSKRESLLSIDLSHDKAGHPEAILKEKRDSNFVSLDIDVANNVIFMADKANENIVKINISDPDVNVEVVARHLVTPDGVAFDWLHRNLYWADAGQKVIGVLGLESDASITLVSKHMHEPRAIVVDPRYNQGWMYWTDWGKRGRIEKAGLDGSHRHTLIQRDIAWPNGLTLDYASDRLFWVDAKFHWIVSCNLHGLDRRTIISKPDVIQHPYSITVFENWIYWTDWSKEVVLKADKVDGDHVTEVASNLRSPMGVVISHVLRQPNDTVRCPELGSRHACSHLCMATPYLNSESPIFKCACPEHLRLSPNGRNCKGIKSHKKQLHRLVLRGDRQERKNQPITKKNKRSRGHGGRKRGHHGHKHLPRDD